MIRNAVTEACLLWLPHVHKLSPRMLGIDDPSSGPYTTSRTRQ